jgi:hypothetical protein
LKSASVLALASAWRVCSQTDICITEADTYGVSSSESEEVFLPISLFDRKGNSSKEEEGAQLFRSLQIELDLS